MQARLFFAIASALAGISCASSTGPASPAAGQTGSPTSTLSEALPAPGPKDTIKGARIVGTVGFTPWHAVKKGAVVYLQDAPKQPGVGMAAAIDNHDMEFVPFISVITAGGSVTFSNTDPLIHNIFSPDGEKWDLGSLVQNGSVTKKFDAPGAYSILCNFHQNMLAYLVVSPSSYFARTTPDGKYAIAGVPAGTYKVTAWAPRLPTATQTVTVGASGDILADFKLQ